MLNTTFNGTQNAIEYISVFMYVASFTQDPL